MRLRLRPHSIFTIVIAVILAVAIWEAREWPLRASILILVLGSAALAMALIQLYKELRSGAKTESSGMDIEADEELTGKKATPKILKFYAWFFGLLISIWLIGFTVAIPIFSFLYAKFHGARWLISIIIAAVSLVILQGLFEQILHIPWPDPVFQQWLPFLPG
ncbi:MAG: tripartite tricarboxylate transporter TctB family protein [Chloroflexi bacterium]|nr:tripartite tricarboxylate transporter TctB family protein [Chloroflexota bacterium]